MANTSQPMQGKVTMVTGATSGIGLETARTLAEQGAAVALVGRSSEKGAALVEQIRQQTGNPDVEFWQADLSSLQEIRQLAESFEQRHPRLDVLVNNVGAVFLRRQVSVDGIEMTFALNHLGVFLLTNLLLDTLEASAPARIVNVSSQAHEIPSQIDLDDLGGKRRYRGMYAYGQAKLALVLFTYELARRLEGTGVTVNALHPGFVATNFAMNNGRLARLFKPLMKLVAISPQRGAETSVYLATSPEVEGISGKYFVEKSAVPSSPASYDQATATRLWETSAVLAGLNGQRV